MKIYKIKKIYTIIISCYKSIWELLYELKQSDLKIYKLFNFENEKLFENRAKANPKENEMVEDVKSSQRLHQSMWTKQTVSG